MKTIILFSLLYLLSFNTYSADLETFTSVRFDHLKKQVIESSVKVSSYGAEKIAGDIQQGIALFRGVYSEIKLNQDTDELLIEVAHGLDLVATAYEKTDILEQDISKVHQQEIEKLQQIYQKTQQKINEFRDKKQGLTQSATELKQQALKLQVTEKELEKLIQSAKQQKLIIDEKTNKNTIPSKQDEVKQKLKDVYNEIYALEAEERLWKAFASEQENLLQQINQFSIELKTLLKTMQAGAEYYRAAANTIRVAKHPRLALIKLAPLNPIQAQLENVQNIWVEINFFTEQIRNLDILDSESQASKILGF